MKNQNDLIISIVAIVLALIIAGVCFGTKREPPTIAAPEVVNLAAPKLPQGDVVMANALPGAGSAGGGVAGAAGGGPVMAGVSQGGGGKKPGGMGAAGM
jgi:hypothetical protein